MSDEEYNSPSGDSGGSDDEGEPGNRRGAQRENNQLPPFTLEQAFGRITNLHQELERARTKLKTKVSWAQILPAVKDKAGRTGLSDDELKIIWEVAKSPHTPGTVTNRSDLMMTLIPERQLETEFVKGICTWLASNVQNEKLRWQGFYKTVLMYLYGITEYSLVPAENIWTAATYARLFHVRKSPGLLVTLFELLKKVSTKNNFSPYHVHMALSLKDIVTKVDQKRATVTLLRKYQVLRPEFFAEDTSRFYIGKRGAEKSVLARADDFKYRLYQAKRRSVQAEDMDADEEEFDARAVVNMNLYPEFAIDFEHYTLETAISKKANKLTAMMWAFMNKYDVLFKLDPTILEHLEGWVDLHWRHKITRQLDSDRRADYFLSRLVDITMTLENGLNTVDDWLLDFMTTWDYTLWQNHMFSLFSYLNFFDVSDIRSKFVFKMLETQFLNGKPDDIHSLWLTLERLLLRWTKAIRLSREQPLEDELEADRRYEDEAVTGLFGIMKTWLIKFIALYLPDKDFREAMIPRMTLTFIKLAQEFNEGMLPFEPVPPLVLVHSIFITDFALAFENLAELMLKMKDWSLSLDPAGEGLQTFKNIEAEMDRFFDIDDQPPMVDLFEKELELARQTEAENLVALIDSALKNLSFESSNTFRLYCVRGPRGQATKLDLNDMKRSFPHLVKYFQQMQKKLFSNPLHSSTPLQTRGRNNV